MSKLPMSKLRWFLLLFSICCFSYSLKAKQIDIAIVNDGNSEWSAAVTQALESELAQFTDRDLSFRLPKEYQYFSEWTHSKAADHLQSALANNNVEIVVALGLLSSDVANLNRYSKPVIAATVVDAELQGYPLEKTGSSGKENLHYLMTNVDLVGELKRFQEATGAQNIGIMVDVILFNALQFLEATFKEIEQQVDFKITPIQSLTNNMTTLVSALPDDIDAVFVIPQFRLTSRQNLELIAALNDRAIPSYSMLGMPDVVSGYLMGTALIPSPQQLARRLAIDIRDIALGRAAADLPITFDVKDRLSINMQTARDIDYSPPFSILFEANLINELANEGRKLTLYSAVDESLQRNLDLNIAKQDYLFAQQDTRIARSSLLPQLNANADYLAQDRDLAVSRQTRTTSLGLGVTQSIYSESNYSQFTSSKFLEQAEQATLEATRLDVIESTAQAYLNVLTAKTELNIQRDNIKLTIANLERAQFRYRVGSGGRSEVLRFETELGNDRQSVTNAQNEYQQSLNQLNQILQRPINEAFQVLEPGLTEPKIFGDERLETFIQSPKQLRIFGDFLTSQAEQNSPELISLDNEIKSQERLLLAAKRKRYVPDIDLSADVDRIVDDSGDPFESDYNNDWSLGVQFSWTLYQGSRISAERSQQEILLRRLQFSYQQTLDQLETDTRNSVSQASASRLNIDYSLASANAAEQTLELVTDAYVRGTADYIDLIDAQSSYLTARLSAANATYTHLIDLISLQRAIGFFDFYVAPEQEEQWFESLNEYAKQYEVKR